MRIELISDQQELVEALQSCQHPIDLLIVTSHLDSKRHVPASPIESLLAYDVCTRTLEDVHDFLRLISSGPRHVLLFTAPQQNLNALLAELPFNGFLDVLPWPAPRDVLTLRLDLMRNDLRLRARTRAAQERKARDAEKFARFHGIAEEAPFFLLGWTEKGQFRYANAKARAFFGLGTNIDPSTEWLTYVHDDEREKLRDLFMRALRHPTPFTCTARLRRCDGAWRWMDIAVGPQFGKRRTFSGLTMLLADITDQKIANETLRDQEQTFRELADSLPVQVWRTAPDGYSNYFNKVWSEYTGIPSHKLSPEDWNSLEHPDDIERVKREWWTAIKSKKPFSLEFRFREAKTGLFKWIWSQAIPIKDEHGQVLRWLGTNLEVDQEKREADRIAMLVRRLVELNRVKDDFILSLSQEMRAPILAILRSSQLLLRDRTFAPEDHEALEAVARNTKSLLHIVNDLLDMSHIVAGKLLLKMEDMDLSQLVQSVLTSLTPSIQKAQITLHTNISPILTTVHADPERLRQIVWNLVDNALKFTPKGGDIRVRVEPNGTSVLLSVEDNGKGVNPAFMPHIFDLFAQEEGYRTRQHGGLGLGLPIVKHLTELHGGRVSISSGGPNAGTKVQVSLPRRLC